MDRNLLICFLTAPLCPDSIEGGTFVDPENCSFFKLDMCNVICDSSPATTTTIQCKEDGSWDNLCSGNYQDQDLAFFLFISNF